MKDRKRRKEGKDEELDERDMKKTKEISERRDVFQWDSIPVHVTTRPPPSVSV